MLQLVGPRTVALVRGFNGCSLWRVAQPFAALDRRNYPAGWDFLGGEADNDPRAELGLPPVSARFVESVFTTLFETAPCDVLVLPRLGWSPTARDARGRRVMDAGLDMLKRHQDAGRTIIYEADDDVFTPWIVEQQRRGLLSDKEVDELEDDRLGRIEVLRACDGATVTNQRLATVLRRYVPDHYPVMVVPNCIDWEFWRASRHQHPRVVPPEVLTIGWAGGGRPDDDLVAMAWGWGQVCQTHPHVQFVVAGCRPAPNGLPSLSATPWVKPILDYVPRHRIIPLGWLDVRAYPALYRNIDIGCAPLANRPFNRCKTPIKVMEYAAAGAAVVASPTVYGSLVTHGEDGYVCETRDEWAAALLELVANEERRRQLARALRRKVAEQHSLEGNLWRWPAAWGDIAASSPLRVPQLARAS